MRNLEWTSPAAQPRAPHKSTRRPPAAPAPGEHPSGPHACITLDHGGRITGFNPRAMALFDQLNGVPGMPIRAVIPDFPLSQNTPGYNLAYAIFHANGGDWTRREAVSADGRKMPVDTLLSSKAVAGKRCITLSLRPVPEHAGG